MVNQSDSATGLFFIRATVFAAIILGIVASLTGAQAGQDKTGLRTAVVNPGRLLSEYKYAKAANDTLEKVDSDAKSAILTWHNYPLLAGADQDALVKLIQKESTPGTELTKGEKEQEQRLKTMHDNLLKEYQELLGKPNGALNAQDVARLDAFSKLGRDSESRIKVKQAEATTDINKQQETFNQKIEKDIHEAINKVAKDKSMNLVFSSQVVLYADTDITDDVVKHLNKL